MNKDSLYSVIMLLVCTAYASMNKLTYFKKKKKNIQMDRHTKYYLDINSIHLDTY